MEQKWRRDEPVAQFKYPVDTRAATSRDGWRPYGKLADARLSGFAEDGSNGKLKARWKDRGYFARDWLIFGVRGDFSRNSSSPLRFIREIRAGWSVAFAGPRRNKGCTALLNAVRYHVTSLYSLYRARYRVDIRINGRVSFLTFDHNNYLQNFPARIEGSRNEIYQPAGIAEKSDIDFSARATPIRRRRRRRHRYNFPRLIFHLFVCGRRAMNINTLAETMDYTRINYATDAWEGGNDLSFALKGVHFSWRVNSGGFDDTAMIRGGYLAERELPIVYQR